MNKIAAYTYNIENKLYVTFERVNKRHLFLILFMLSTLSFYMINRDLVFVALLMGYIFFHESGHILACMLYRMKIHGLYFIPFLGGCVLFDCPYEKKKYFNIIIAGPASGLIYIMLLCAIHWIANGSFTGPSKFNMLIPILTVINIINILPFYPFDGGRMIAAIGLSITEHFGWISRTLSFLVISGLLYFCRNSLFEIFVLLSVYLISGFGKLSYHESNGQDMSNKEIIVTASGNVYAGIMLDHDLQENIVSRADMDLNGMNVVDAIVSYIPNDVPILVHSTNETQGPAMARRLESYNYMVMQISMNQLVPFRIIDVVNV